MLERTAGRKTMVIGLQYAISKRFGCGTIW